MKIAVTKRFYLRELSVNDAEDFYQLNLDPEVIKYTGDKPFESIEHARIFLENYDAFKKHGFGRWAVTDNLNGEFLGWCGLKYSESINEYDIGFRFYKKHWNKGFATESSKSCLNLAFNKFGINEIVGRAAKENLASIKVLKKLNMVFDEFFDFDGSEGLIYKIRKCDFIL